MPYKDKDMEREAAKERQRKHRQGVTSEGVTQQGVTWGEPTVLSDGQLWWPGHEGLHPPGCECGIKHTEKPAC